MPNDQMLRELESVGMWVWLDIAYLYSQVIEHFATIGGIDKAKLHFLAKVLSKDLSFIPFNFGLNNARRRFSQLLNVYKKILEKKSKNKIVLKYAQNINLSRV